MAGIVPNGRGESLLKLVVIYLLLIAADSILAV